MTLEIVSTGQWTETSIDQLLVEGRAHGAVVSVILEDMPPGSGPRLHWHPYGETWVVISGRIAFSDGTMDKEAGPGDVVYIPPNEPHRFTVTGSERIRMVCIHQSETFVTHWL